MCEARNLPNGRRGTARYIGKKRFRTDIAAARLAPMFMKLQLSCLLAALITPFVSFADQAGADAAFQKLADEFIHGEFLFNPLSGVSLGLHEYDGRVPNYG